MILICVEHLWIVFGILDLATAVIRFPDRKESILGQTYFNSIGVGAGGARGAIVPPLFKVGG